MTEDSRYAALFAAPPSDIVDQKINWLWELRPELQRSGDDGFVVFDRKASLAKAASLRQATLGPTLGPSVTSHA